MKKLCFVALLSLASLLSGCGLFQPATYTYVVNDQITLVLTKDTPCTNPTILQILSMINFEDKYKNKFKAGVAHLKGEPDVAVCYITRDNVPFPQATGIFVADEQGSGGALELKKQ